MTFRHYSHNRKRLPSWVTGDVMTPSSIHDAYLCGEVALCFSPLVDVSQANLGPMYRCLLTLFPSTTAVKNNRPRVVSLFEGQTWWWCMKTSHPGAVYLTGTLPGHKCSSPQAAPPTLSQQQYNNIKVAWIIICH